MPVHVYGGCAKMDEIVNISKENNLHIVEDAAPSLGGEFKKKKIGSFGDASAFSFQGAKVMTTGEGGIFLTDNSELFKKISKKDIGMSIACDGVCLTLINISNKLMEFYLSNETIKRSKFKDSMIGDKINLELPLKYGQKISGHICQGHVDTVGTINKIIEEDKSLIYDFKINKKDISKGKYVINDLRKDNERNYAMGAKLHDRMDEVVDSLKYLEGKINGKNRI